MIIGSITDDSIQALGAPATGLSQLSHAEKDALTRALFQRLEAAQPRIAELEARLGEPPKTLDNSRLPPSKGQKPNQPENAGQSGPRQGNLGRKGGGRPLACDPDETVIAKSVACVHCEAALGEADQVLQGVVTGSTCRWFGPG